LIILIIHNKGCRYFIFYQSLFSNIPSWFLNAFAKLWRATITFILSVWPHGTTWLQIDGFFKKFGILKFLENLSGITSNSHKDLARWRLHFAEFFSQREISQSKFVEEIKLTFHVVFFFFLNLAFCEIKCRRVVNQTGHKWQFNLAHTLFMLDI